MRKFQLGDSVDTLGVFSSRRTNEQDLGPEEQTCFKGVVHSFDWLRARPRSWSSFFSRFQTSWSLVHLPWKKRILCVFSSRRTNDQDLGPEEQSCFQGFVHSFDWLRAWPRSWSSFFSRFQASWSLVHLPWKNANILVMIYLSALKRRVGCDCTGGLNIWILKFISNVFLFSFI